MTYELKFHEKALEEYQNLPPQIRDQLKRKIEERLEFPKVPGSRLRGHPNRYKIKLRRSGIRAVYEVQDDRVVMQVIAVGRRDRSAVYKAARKR